MNAVLPPAAAGAAAPPRRILMTADTVGGVWTYALELARALGPHGVQIALATMGAPVSPAQRAALAELPNVELHESGWRLEWMDDPWADADRAGEWLLEIAAEFAPDIIHLNGYAHGALPWEAPVLIVAHSCVLSWHSAVRGGPAPAAYDEYRRRVRDGLNAAGLVAAPTAAMLDALREHYGALPPSLVIPNARDARRFVPAPKQPRILSAGRLWDEAKNVRALDAAAPLARWPIHVAGDGAHPSGGQTRLANARPLGKLAPREMAAQLAAAAIYALPARYEPFGLSALEAGLCGCALVLGDIPSLREVWGDAAVFVEPDAAAQLARALNALIDEAPRRADLGRRARARALRFSPQTMAREYLLAYQTLLTQRATIHLNVEAAAA